MTFRQSVNAFADRALDTALGTVEAGACVPSNGKLCACLSWYSGYCQQHSKLAKWIYSCLGQCNHVLINSCCP